jgi:hypothetical protein
VALRTTFFDVLIKLLHMDFEFTDYVYPILVSGVHYGWGLDGKYVCRLLMWLFAWRTSALDIWE